MNKRDAKKEAYNLIYFAIGSILGGENIINEKVYNALKELETKFYCLGSKERITDLYDKLTNLNK